MERKPILPSVLTLIACREIYTREVSGTPEATLVCPTINFWSWFYPADINMGLFAEFTGGHGDYVPCFELHDINGETINRVTGRVFPAHDPIGVHAIHGPFRAQVPAPGRYDLVLLMNDEEAARRQIWVRSPQIAGKEE